MNKVILMGRLTRDVETRYTNGNEPMAISRFTLAVDRKYSKDSNQNADFISCVAFKKTAEFLEKYGKKGTKIVVEGRIQTGSYEKDGNKVYTTDVVVENVEFAESKNTNQTTEANTQPAPQSKPDDGFMYIPEGIQEELPFV